jgi:hypothetical protein
VKEPLASRLLFPLTERAFVYGRYDGWIAGLAPATVVPLRELAVTPAPAVGLRHDVDSRLESALALARIEQAHGVRATYFVLHTSSYYRDREATLRSLRVIQDDLGHEIGWHNDLATLQLVHGVDAATYLARELEWLRAAGIRITGAAAHGSPHCHRLGYLNNYVFSGWDEPQPGFPRTNVGVKLNPTDFGLEYEAYHLPNDLYFSDSSFDGSRRRHPAGVQLDQAQRTIVLIHPCHWDASTFAKWRRLAAKLARLSRNLSRS